MSPSGWSREWSARGDSNPDLHGLKVPRLPIAPRADMVGPSGWIRTITSRVKSPACCVDTTEGMERMTGFEPVPQGLEGPWATVTPHSLWIGLRVSSPSLHAGNVGCILHTQAEHGPVSFTGLSTSVSFQRPRSFELVGSKGFEPNRSWGERVYGPSADHPLRTAHLATAPGVEPGPTSFGGSDAPVTPRCLRHLTSRLSQRHTLPLAWPVSPQRLEAKQKRPSRGSP